MEHICCNHIKNEVYNPINNNEILNLKRALSAKDQIILNLQKELEFNNLNNNLRVQHPFLLNKNFNNNNILNKYDSYKDIKDNLDLMSMKTNSMNKNIILEDIQKQILELNIELQTKKNLLIFSNILYMH